MQTILASKAGFCFGVKRAIDLVIKTYGETANKVYTLGPLIHNPQVVDDLSQKGIEVVKDISDISTGVVVIRSHGVGPDVINRAGELGLQVVDATCPFVKKVQEAARELNEQGYRVVVVGDKEHPEVAGIIGWTDNKGIVVETSEQAEDLPPMPKVGVISQTTQPEANFDKIVAVLQKKTGEIKVINTICHATVERQAAAVELAEKVDIMIVIGGKNSANTMKLARLCTATGTPTYQVETSIEINQSWLKGKNIVGITAGASTPDWIIEEVKRIMEDITNRENEKQQMEDALTIRELHKGDIVTGFVVQVGDDEVMVDVGGKSEGVIPLRECSCSDMKSPKEIFKVGDEVKVAVISVKDDEGKILLSKRKVDAEKAWDMLKEAMESNAPVEGTANEVVKGGLLVDVGVQGFMPASLVDLGYVDDLNKYVGVKLSALVIEVNRESRKVILARKPLLEKAYQEKKSSLWSELEEGQVRKGMVKRLTNFGAFVDIGGIDGLLHVSEMAWYRVTHPSEILKENDEIEVFVLSADKEKDKVSLSLKKIIPNPWQSIGEKYCVGKQVAGKVVRIAPFGAFVELEPGIDGLIHISQFSDKRIASPGEAVKVGEQVTAQVTEIDLNKHKISLSIKQLQKDDEKTEETDELAKLQQTQAEISPVTLGDTLSEKLQQELAKVSAPVEEAPTEEAPTEEKPKEENIKEENQ